MLCPATVVSRWNWNMDSSPFSFRGTNFFRELENPSRKSFPTVRWLIWSFFPHPPRELTSRIFPRYWWGGLSGLLTFPPGAAVGRSLTHTLWMYSHSRAAEADRNAWTVLAQTVLYPLWEGRQQNIEAEARTCAFSSSALEQQKLFEMVSSRKLDAAPLFFTLEYLTLQNR